MTSSFIDLQALRLDGIYQQRQKPYLMMRIKLAGGILSAEQARLVADISERYARGKLHLTTRCSIELHWLEAEVLPDIADLLRRVGLTSRGACGGAVRGVSVAAPGLHPLSYPFRLATRLQRHFTGNPRYEGLPKKFKIGIQQGNDGEAKYLIQDVGIVITDESPSLFDVWVAGGLGREPREGFLLETGLPEERLIPVVEAVVEVYATRGTSGKRVKHLVAENGREEFVAAVQHLVSGKEPMLFRENLVVDVPTAGEVVEAAVFAGEIDCAAFRRAADIAERFSDGWLAVTPDQNLAFYGRKHEEIAAVQAAIADSGISGESPAAAATFRVCPGNHECRLGLSATRDIASRIMTIPGREGERASWAISGCSNSCSQPQLADFGIVTTRLIKADNDEMVPVFDFYRRSGTGCLSTAVATVVSEADLLHLILHQHS